MNRNQRIRVVALLGVVGAAAALGGCGTTFAYSTHERHYGHGGSRHYGHNWGHDRHYGHGGGRGHGDGHHGGGHGRGGHGGGGHGGGGRGH